MVLCQATILMIDDCLTTSNLASGFLGVREEGGPDPRPAVVGGCRRTTEARSWFPAGLVGGERADAAAGRRDAPVRGCQKDLQQLFKGKVDS